MDTSYVPGFGVMSFVSRNVDRKDEYVVGEALDLELRMPFILTLIFDISFVRCG